jgi:hypothetical protein
MELKAQMSKNNERMVDKKPFGLSTFISSFHYSGISFQVLDFDIYLTFELWHLKLDDGLFILLYYILLKR